MSTRPDIPDKIKTRLWVLAGGRCQYEGCNGALWRDDLTMAKMNRAYIAHIRDVNPKTHRYDPELSPELATDIVNLMLLCDKHHRLIDREEEKKHPVDRLERMKQQHEERIELLTSIQIDKKSHVLLYGANIGKHTALLSWKKAAQAMIPLRYPAEPRGIELSLRNSSFEDHNDDYWTIERKNLKNNLDKIVRPRLVSGDTEHLSVFALAPQPLLVELGRLLSDIPAAEVYQLHREPPDWNWQEHPEGFEYIVEEPKEVTGCPALVISLSATITDDRIRATLGDDLTIWRVTIPEPNNMFLKSRRQLQQFREIMRPLMDKIKAVHGDSAVLNVFMAAPVAIAVELGRIIMPKADLPLCIYDQNRKLGGFVKTLTFP